MTACGTMVSLCMNRLFVHMYRHTAEKNKTQKKVFLYNQMNYASYQYKYIREYHIIHMSEAASEEPKAAAPETKAQLVQYIKSWIETDNDMRKLQKDMKTLRDNKKMLTDALVNVMKSNEIDVFDINDGKLVYSKTKVKAPINKTSLFAALLQHYNDEEAAKKLSEFIMDSRQEKIKESIRRKIQK
jgi:hypothetical protein